MYKHSMVIYTALQIHTKILFHNAQWITKDQKQNGKWEIKKKLLWNLLVIIIYNRKHFLNLYLKRKYNEKNTGLVFKLIYNHFLGKYSICVGTSKKGRISIKNMWDSFIGFISMYHILLIAPPENTIRKST